MNRVFDLKNHRQPHQSGGIARRRADIRPPERRSPAADLLDGRRAVARIPVGDGAGAAGGGTVPPRRPGVHRKDRQAQAADKSSQDEEGTVLQG